MFVLVVFVGVGVVYVGVDIIFDFVFVKFIDFFEGLGGKIIIVFSFVGGFIGFVLGCFMFG